MSALSYVRTRFCGKSFRREILQESDCAFWKILIAYEVEDGLNEYPLRVYPFVFFVSQYGGFAIRFQIVSLFRESKLPQATAKPKRRVFRTNQWIINFWTNWLVLVNCSWLKVRWGPGQGTSLQFGYSWGWRMSLEPRASSHEPRAMNHYPLIINMNH